MFDGLSYNIVAHQTHGTCALSRPLLGISLGIGDLRGPDPRQFVHCCLQVDQQ